MVQRGILIAFEGIDGSGKQTQVRLLEHELAARGYPVHSTGFPQYDSCFGKMVAQFLNGEFGPLESVDPHFTALLYAGDRFEAKTQLMEALSKGSIVLADRYIASNLAHQTARVPVAQRAAFLPWIEHLEYNIYGLPHEDLIIYLRVPAQEAQNLIARKSARDYTESKRDLQEASLRHLEEAADMYDLLSRGSPWATIQCYDAVRGGMRLPEEISAEIIAAVQPLLAGVGRS
jgi:dTMP kinase